MPGDEQLTGSLVGVTVGSVSFIKVDNNNNNMRTTVSFACALLVIACTTVTPSDTWKHSGGPPHHHMGLSDEDLEQVRACVTDFAGDSEPQTPEDMHKMHVVMMFCGLQTKGMLSDGCKLNSDAIDSMGQGNSTPNA